MRILPLSGKRFFPFSVILLYSDVVIVCIPESSIVYVISQNTMFWNIFSQLGITERRWYNGLGKQNPLKFSFKCLVGKTWGLW